MLQKLRNILFQLMRLKFYSTKAQIIQIFKAKQKEVSRFYSSINFIQSDCENLSCTYKDTSNDIKNRNEK